MRPQSTANDMEGVDYRLLHHVWILTSHNSKLQQCHLVCETVSTQWFLHLRKKMEGAPLHPILSVLIVALHFMRYTALRCHGEWWHFSEDQGEYPSRHEAVYGGRFCNSLLSPFLPVEQSDTQSLPKRLTTQWPSRHNGRVLVDYVTSWWSSMSPFCWQTFEFISPSTKSINGNVSLQHVVSFLLVACQVVTVYYISCPFFNFTVCLWHPLGWNFTQMKIFS